jgi:ferredoxin
MNKYILKFSTEVVGSPLLAETILETGTAINILRAKVDYDEGTLVISVLGDEKKQSRVVEVLMKKGVDVSRLKKGIVNEEEKCVNCGACISVCPAGAISFDDKRSITLDKEKCHRCGVCVEVCPRRSLSIQEM